MPPEAAPQPSPSTALEREHAEMRDRLLRTLAEMENLRKRTEREVADSRLYGVTSFARDILVVADNMRRALEAVPPEVRANAQGSVKALVDGVELTERELLKALEKNGVRQYSPQGEKFDPNLHQAMFEVPDASIPAGSVTFQVVQPGYKIGERVLAAGAGRRVERWSEDCSRCGRRQRQFRRRSGKFLAAFYPRSIADRCCRARCAAGSARRSNCRCVRCRSSARSRRCRSATTARP